MVWKMDVELVVGLCAVSKGCNLSCSDPDGGPCVSLRTCRCIRGPSDKTCDIGE